MISSYELLNVTYNELLAFDKKTKAIRTTGMLFEFIVSGVSCGWVTPLPIPNRAVKAVSADGTSFEGE